MLFDRFDSPIGELSPSEVFELSRKEEVNGEHSLTVTTTRILQQGWRILTEDGTGKWREHVVYGTDALHDTGERPFGTYYCTWSLQHDLMGTRVSSMPGVQTPVAAGSALSAALGGTARWQSGTVTNTALGGGSMYDMDGWSAIGVLVAVWGGEIDATIEVGSFGVLARKVDYYSKQGDQTPKRRYDFGADLRSVRRRIADGPLYCRITPRGKGEETDTGGYGRKVTIESVNSGRDYLQNSEMVDVAKLPDGSGGWEYPTLEVENPDCETPAELLAWSQSVLEEYTAPKVSYEVDVMQLASEGTDMHGVALGDAVHIVDRKFGDGVRVSGRVVSETVNMLDETDVQLTIGYIDGGLAGLLGGMEARVGALTATVQGMNGGTLSTAEYLSRLLDRLNTEINATGGYTYITEGQGIRTYDRAVSDPMVGSEASAVVEIKGGTIRIANTKTSQGAWNWRTVFTSGHIAADMVTTAHLTAGYIGNASGGNYWNLDTGELRMASTTTVGGQTVQQIANSAASSAASGVNNGLNQVEILRRLTGGYTTEGLYISNGHLYANASVLKTGIITDGVGKNYWNLNTGDFKLAGDALSDALDIGARNYLDGTADYSEWRKKGRFSFSGANAICASKASVANWDDRIMSPLKKLKYSELRGNKATLSFEALSADAWGTKSATNQVVVTFALLNANNQRVAYFNRTLALTTSWVRKKFTVNLVDSSFSYDSGMSGSLSGLYLVMQIYNRSKHKIQMRRFKLERGTTATGWSRSEADQQKYAQNAAKAEADALNSSLNAQKIFNKLTNNGQLQAIVRDSTTGKLYINGEYIKAKTLSGNVIYGGILTDKAGKNKWNLNTGELVTKNMKAENATLSGKFSCEGKTSDYEPEKIGVSVENGSIDFTCQNRWVGSIGTAGRGVCINAKDGIVFYSNYLNSWRPKDSSYAANAISGTLRIPIATSVAYNGKGGMSLMYGCLQLRFVNGICFLVTYSPISDIKRFTFSSNPYER